VVLYGSRVDNRVVSMGECVNSLSDVNSQRLTGIKS